MPMWKIDCYECGWLQGEFETEYKVKKVMLLHENFWEHLAVVVRKEEYEKEIRWSQQQPEC